ncbi:MAG: NHL repeat-containing protein [Acidimicrobiales bacterium]
MVLPSGYGVPIALTADPVRPGFWFMAANATKEALFFWNTTTRTLSTYVFGGPSDPLDFGIQAGIAIAPSGTVWAGVDRTLVELNPATGAIVRIPIPITPTNPTIQAQMGSQGAGLLATHSVSSLVALANGNLAIASSFTSVVLYYNPSAGTFTSVGLPAGDLPSSLSVSGDNVVVSLAAGGSVDVITAGDTVKRATIPSLDVGCGAELCATIPSQQDVYSFSMSSAGSVSQVMDTVVGTPKLRLGSNPTVLGGTILAATTTGFLLVNPSSGVYQAYTLPGGACSTQGISIASGSVPAEGRCQESSTAYTVDSAGNIWFTSNDGAADIYEIPASAY